MNSAGRRRWEAKGFVWERHSINFNVIGIRRTHAGRPNADAATYVAPMHGSWRIGLPRCLGRFMAWSALSFLDHLPILDSLATADNADDQEGV